MTLKEAYYKQKDELHAAQREICKLNKELEASRKGVAAEGTFQKQLSQIRGLKNKVSEMTRISDRYKALYQSEQAKVATLSDKVYDLELEVLHLKDRLELYEQGSSDSLTTSEEAEVQIAALKDEVARLTALLNHDGTNTGLPTSKTSIAKKKVIPNSREKTGRSKGGQFGHRKHSMPHFPDEEINEVKDHTLSFCPKCGGHNLIKTSVTNKDEYEYVVKVIKRRNRFTEYLCSDCGKNVRAPFMGLVAPNQYGSTIQAMALSLMNVGIVSINRTKRILSGFSDDPISLSDSYLCKLQKRYSKELQSFVNCVKKYMLGVSLLYWDDTVVFINTSRACMRFYGDGIVSLYTAHNQKDLAGIMDDGILPSLSEGTTVMHDHNSINYHEGFIFKNIECIQHLERDLQKLADDSFHEWPMRLKELITSSLHRRKLLLEQGIYAFSKKEIDDIFRNMRSILEDGYKEYISGLGHFYESDERALLNRLEQYSDNYFAWVRNFDLPTTNNLSERSLRFTKTKSKISGQFESIEYASYFADIRTYLGTCSANGINEYNALLRLTQGNPYTLTEVIGGAV